MTSEIDQRRAPGNIDLKTLLAFADKRLQESVGIARAADVCAGVGKSDDAVRIALGIEPLLYEVRSLINTASILNRMQTG